MEQDTGFEPALSVWKTDVLAADTNPAYRGAGEWSRTTDLSLMRRTFQPSELLRHKNYVERNGASYVGSSRFDLRHLRISLTLARALGATD